MYYQNYKNKKSKIKSTSNKTGMVIISLIILIAIFFGVFFYFNSRSTNFKRIQTYIDNRKFTKAQNLIQIMEKKSEIDPILYYYKGYLNYYKKDFFYALLEFKKSYFFISGNSNIPVNINYYIGYCYYYLGKDYFSYASKYLSLYIKLAKSKDYDYLQIYYTLGDIETQLENWDSANNYFSKIYGQYLDNMEFLYKFGIVCKNLNYDDKAIEYLTKVIGNTHNPELKRNSIYLLGKIYIKKQNLTQAKKYFLDLLELKQDSSMAYYYLAYIEYLNKDFEAAKELIFKSLLIDSNNNDSKELLQKMNN